MVLSFQLPLVNMLKTLLLKNKLVKKKNVKSQTN